MALACPLNYQQIDATLVRIASFYIIASVIAFLLTSNIYLLYWLAIDTMFRIYGPKGFSMVYQLASMTKYLLRLPDKMSDAAAKRLASQFAMLFVLMLIVGYHLEMATFIYAVAAVFLFCAALELLFDFCVGCKVYYIMKALFPGFHT